MQLDDLRRRKVIKQKSRRKCEDCAHATAGTDGDNWKFPRYCLKYDKWLTADNKQFTLQGTDKLCEFKER